MTNNSAATLSDRDLLEATAQAADAERRSTADLITLLAELDTRQLYLGEGYSSLFTYCTQALHLSEPAAYRRITAARRARRFPTLLTRLAEGTVTLTTLGMLATHLTDDNHETLLDAVRHKTKRDVERLIACLCPQPDIPPSVRKLPATARAHEARRFPSPASPAIADAQLALEPAPTSLGAGDRHLSSPPAPRSVLAPLAPERYLLRVTLSQDTHDKLERARALLRHTVPNGDPAAVIDRALTVLVAQLERTRLAAAQRPRGDRLRTARTRHVPAAVRRVVWARDEGRCAFVGTTGRCAEQQFLEFHHVQPFAEGGASDVDNLQLRCRAHNAYEARLYFDFGDTSSSAFHG